MSAAQASQTEALRAVVGEERNADARLDLHRQAGERHRNIETGADPLGEADRALGIGRARRDDGELVPAESGDRVRIADQRAEPVTEPLEEQVAALVAERVVDLLEAIEVEQEDRDA